MFDYNILILGRLEHAEAVVTRPRAYVSLSDGPSFVRRLLTVLRGVGRGRVPQPHPGAADPSRPSRAGAAAAAK